MKMKIDMNNKQIIILNKIWVIQEKIKRIRFKLLYKKIEINKKIEIYKEYETFKQQEYKLWKLFYLEFENS